MSPTIADAATATTTEPAAHILGAARQRMSDPGDARSTTSSIAVLSASVIQISAIASTAAHHSPAVRCIRRPTAVTTIHIPIWNHALGCVRSM